ncbi:ABC transporter family substrate-binding protein [soil metagenome]
MTASVASLAMVLAACGGGDDPADPGDGGDGDATERSGSMVYGEGTAFPENLFPLIAAGNSTATSNILVRIQPGAFRVFPDFTIQWDEDTMASEPTASDESGQQVVTYEINEEAVWSDGTPITVDDFEFTWRLQRSSDPADGGCEALISTTGYDLIESVEGDGKDVTVTFSEVYPDWQGLFSLYPAHLVDQGDDAANCEMLTTGWPTADGLPEDFSGGPWQLLAENIDVGQQVLTLTPNPEWWGEGPLLQALIYQNIGTESSTLVSGMQSGEINLINAQPQLDLVGQMQALEPNVTSSTNFGLIFEHFDLNTANVHLAKPEVRQAFALALDRQEITTSTVGAFDDRAQVLNNRLWVNNQPAYEDTAPEQYNTRDVAAATKLLESVGYVLEGGTAVHPEDGPLQLTMSTTQANPLREQTIDLASVQLAEAGFAITKFLDPDIFAGADKPTSLEARGFDVALFAWVSSPFTSGVVSLYETGGGQNYAGVANEEVDELLGQLATEIDPDVAADIANQVDALLWEELVTIPLYQKPGFSAWTSTYEGIEPNETTAGILWNSDEFALVQ